MITIRLIGTNGVYKGEINEAFEDLLYALDIDGTSPATISEVEELRSLLLAGEGKSQRAMEISSNIGISF